MKAVKFLLVATLFVTSLMAKAQLQANKVSFDVEINDEETDLPVSDAGLAVTIDGQEVKTMSRYANGKFIFSLDMDHDYKITFNGPGYISKTILVDTRNISAGLKADGYGFVLDSRLFKPEPGKNYDLLNEPVAKAKFLSSANALVFDLDYSQEMASKITALRGK